MITHGHRRGKKTPTYGSWDSMIQRCYSPGYDSYRDYGARGIRVCDRWRVFANFLADMGERPTGTTLDRIDSRAGYGPSNCRWLDAAENCRRHSTAQWVAIDGEWLTRTQCAQRYGIPAGTLLGRLKKGMPLETALQLGKATPWQARRAFAAWRRAAQDGPA